MKSPRPTPKRDSRGWQALASRLLDCIYPPRCGICDAGLRDGRAMCDACDADLPRLRAPFCQACGEAFDGKIDGAFACPNCHRIRFAFEFARPALLRDERTLDLIHRLKYGRELHLAGELGRLATDAFEDARLGPALAEKWPLVPVPLHRSRYQQRHFNQAEEIAREIARHTGQPVIRVLKRTRATLTQTALHRRQRMENLKGAFGLSAKGAALLRRTPAGVILVDDVLTTGSTMHACAKVLRDAGFPRIVAVTVMRG
jgi:competence protein ComFC